MIGGRKRLLFHFYENTTVSWLVLNCISIGRYLLLADRSGTQTLGRLWGRDK